MKKNRQSAYGLLQRSAALAFVLLMLSFAMVQAAHFHVNAGSDADAHCSLCLATHPVAEMAPVAQPQPMATAMAVASSRPQPVSRRALPATFIRPPPAAL
jgi:hypothetical protein